jgi:hypothetical protein
MDYGLGSYRFNFEGYLFVVLHKAQCKTYVVSVVSHESNGSKARYISLFANVDSS